MIALWRDGGLSALNLMDSLEEELVSLLSEVQLVAHTTDGSPINTTMAVKMNGPFTL